MFTRQDDIRHLIVRYFEQQKELYGDDFIMSREQFGLLENSLGLSQPGASKVVSANSGEDSSPDQAKALQSFYQQIKDCQNCSLGKTRNRSVFGIGNPNAEAMLIGEAPGRDEDRVGEPFVGQAGQLLTKMLAAIKFERKEVFIANILKCRPPNNRDPLPTEVDECEPYLHQQIEIVKPSIILALGRV
ncbi:MAG: uracil-DNA glycosylase, partial [bacterium]